MKKLLLSFSLLAASLVSFGQFIEGETSFSKEYSQIRGFTYSEIDSAWVYDRGGDPIWTIVFNVDIFTTADGAKNRGAIMLNDVGAARYAYIYIGNVRNGKDENIEYSEFTVDIINWDEDESRWVFWDEGVLRHYGEFTKLYVSDWYRFDYFNR